jgi:acyl-coenzyme A thioesterase PaaI-like protein
MSGLAPPSDPLSLRPAVGERFIARARVVKPGRTQVFTHCELFAVANGVEKLVATGETLLTPVADEGA